MDAFTVHTGRVVPLRRSNVDTDQIIPAVYLKRVTRTGFEDGLFAAWRGDRDFVLNQPERQGATVLVAGPEFGTGSSREHAVWALQNYGFRVVISLGADRGRSDRRDHGGPDGAGGPFRRPDGTIRARSLCPLAFARGSGRHRADPPSRRRHRGLRVESSRLVAHDGCLIIGSVTKILATQGFRDHWSL